MNMIETKKPEFNAADFIDVIGEIGELEKKLEQTTTECTQIEKDSKKLRIYC